LTATIEVTSDQPAASAVDREKLAAYYAPSKDAPFSQDDFEALLGRPVPSNQGPQKGAYTLNTPIGDMGDSFIGRQFYKTMRTQMSNMIQGQEDTPTALLMEAVMHEMPLRGMLMTGDGPLTREMLEALLLMINGRFFKGVGALVRAMLTK
jgi:beta-glucosidase